LDIFADDTIGAESEVIAFNDNEFDVLGDLVDVFSTNGSLHVIGSNGSLLDIIDSDRRGTLITHEFVGDDT
jgi:hypothetical protein